jgi:hypothetical protein
MGKGKLPSYNALSSYMLGKVMVHYKDYVYYVQLIQQFHDSSTALTSYCNV